MNRIGHRLLPFALGACFAVGVLLFLPTVRHPAWISAALAWSIGLLLLADVYLLGLLAFAEDPVRKRCLPPLKFSAAFILTAFLQPFLLPPVMRDGPICSFKIRQCARAVLLYQADNNETLPPAQGWLSGARVYVGMTSACVNDPEHVSYALNEKFAGNKLSQIPSFENTVLVFESLAPQGSVGSLADFTDQSHDGQGYIVFGSLRTRKFNKLEAAELRW